MTDARSDLAGAINALAFEIETLFERLSRIEAKLPAFNSYTLSDIARTQGVTVGIIQHQLWRQPNFGQPDLSGNPKRWSRAAVEAWMAVPIEDHRKRWDLMNAQERRRARGAA